MDSKTHMELDLLEETTITQGYILQIGDSIGNNHIIPST